MAASAAPTPNIAPLLAGAAVVAGIGFSVMRLPGALIALLLLIVAACMSTPPPLTGKKDAGGYLTVGNAGEEQAMLRHRMWSYSRWRLLFPTKDWLLNDIAEIRELSQRADQISGQLPQPLRRLVSTVKVALVVVWLIVPTSFSSMVAIGAAFVVFTLPVDGLDVWGLAPGAGLWLMWPNAIATFVIVQQLTAARRRFAAISDPRPPVTVTHLVAACSSRDRHVAAILSAAAGISAVTATAVLVALNAMDIAWLITPPLLAAAGAALMAAAGFLRAQSLPEAHVDWENTVAARAAWVADWQTLKVDPEPYLLSHTRLGGDDQLPVRVDTFEASPTLGAAGALALLQKIAPTRGAGMRVSVLNEPDVDGQGQPISGSKHPLRFTVVSWPVDTVVDVGDPNADADMVRVLLRTAAAANTGGWPQPMLVDLQPVFVRDAPQRDGDGDDIEGTVSTAAYVTVWAAPDADYSELMPTVAGGAAGYIRGEAIADKSAGAVMYVGALTSGSTVFDDDALGERFEILARESAWDERWYNVLKMGEQRPWIQSAVYKKATLPSGQVIECQPFMTPQGIQSEAYIGEEKERKLQSTLNNAPFVSIIGWPANGDRPGERHPGAFRVLWSAEPISANPAQITPGSNGPSGEAVKWALSAAVNRGFDSAKLPRPEMINATALTSRQSRQHIWDLTLRLYGGVTLLAVKAAAEKIRQGMGAAPWLRITGHQEGVRIVVGAVPQPVGSTGQAVQFSRPRNRDVTTALDWEQVFIDAKLVSPVDGSAPKLTEATELETNDQVESLTFTIPRGLSITDFQEPKAIDRMRVNARKVFIDVRHTDSADTMRLLVCEVDPMPLPAPFMWDVVGAEERSTAFATNVEGAAVTWDLDLDSHLLILGSNGSGKGMAATSLLTDMLMSGWDVFAADPTKGFNDFAYADPWLKYRATTYADTVATMRKMVELLEERKELNSKYGVANIKDLPTEVRPPITCCIIDEFTSLVIPEQQGKLPDTASEQDQHEHARTAAINNAKAAISGAAGRVLREGRATGLVMVVMGQKFTANEAKHVPGGSTLKSQMSRLAMGKMNFGDMMSAFNDAPSAMGLLGSSVPRGRGIFESTAQAAFAVQTWWAGGTNPEHFQVMHDHIAAVRAPLTEAARFDPEPYRPAPVDGTPVFGRRIDDDTDEVVDVGVVDLGEIDLGVVDDISFDDFDFDTPADVSGVPQDELDGDHDDDLTDALQPAGSVTFVGPGAPADDPAHVDVDELPPGAEITGSPAVDAIVAWVAAHPGTTEVRWLSPLASVLDEIGLTHGELAESALAELDAVLVLEQSAPESSSGPAHVEESVAPSPPPPAPAPVPTDTPPALTPEVQPVVSDDLFDAPTPTSVHVADNLFD